MKTNWRHLAYGFLLGIALDLVGAYLLAWLITEEPSSYFPLYAAILILLPAPLAAWTLAKKWFYFFLFGKEGVARWTLKEFHRSNFPSPNGEFDIDQFLLETIQNKGNKDEARISASSLAGQIVSARSLAGFSSGMMMTIGAQEALQRYRPREQTPAPQHPDQDFFREATGT